MNKYTGGPYLVSSLVELPLYEPPSYEHAGVEQTTAQNQISFYIDVGSIPDDGTPQ